ncbi:MAG TPA: hypothetical protein VFZ21_29735 [Gemmatimonadaceae bacterium]|nr:hypothetical protein [Gemmatimonadaceae bacterium]
MPIPSCRPWLLIAALLGSVACRGDTASGPDSGTLDEFRIVASATELAEGDRATLSIAAHGTRVDASRVTWETRNAAAFAVNGGVVQALAPGMGYVVARSSAAADSVAIAVRFPTRPASGAIFKVGQAVDEPIRLSGMAIMIESLRSGARSTDIFAHSRPVGSPLSALDAAFSGDSILAIRFPRQLAVGLHSVGSFEVDNQSGLRITGGDGIYLRLRDGENRWRMYFSVGTSTMEITSVTLPEAMGNIPGKVTGRVQFDAAGFVHAVGERGAPSLTPIGDRVVPVFAEFAVDLYHHPVSGNVAELTGRYAGTWRTGGSGGVSGGALTMRWNGLLNFGTPNETLVEAMLRVPQPAQGTFSFAPAGAASVVATLGMTFGRFVRVPPGDLPIGHVENVVAGTASDGALTITDYRAPTDDHFGVLRARLTATIAFPSGDNPGTVSITDFVLPIAPLEGDVLDPAQTTSITHR